jgi:hypothetical protein
VAAAAAAAAEARLRRSRRFAKYSSPSVVVRRRRLTPSSHPVAVITKHACARDSSFVNTAARHVAPRCGADRIAREFLLSPPVHV